MTIRALAFLFLFIAIQVGIYSKAEALRKKENILSIQDNLFYMNGRPFDMWGIRVASASQSEEVTEHLIAQLDDYNQYGVNTINVYFQGSSGGFSDPFLKDGKKIDKNHLERMKRIIKACRERGMVVIIGIFYQRAMADMDGVRNISSSEGVKNAVRTVARELKGYGNIILNIANEQNSGFYKRCDFYDFNDPENIIQLCREIKKQAPSMIIGGGGYHDESNVVIGLSSAVDVLLFDTFDQDVENGQHSRWHYDFFIEKGVKGKPIVNVEMFGGWTKKFMPPGVYAEEGKQQHQKDVDEAADTPGLYVHFHSNPWCQGPSIGKEIRYDLGGMGNKNDPGIRWWFDYVQKQTSRQKSQ